MGRVIAAAAENIGHLVFPWTESVKVTVHADKECDLQPAAAQIRAGDFNGAAETMQKAIERQCGAPDDKIALAKAYHNRGVALTYAGKPDEGLKSLEQAHTLWPGNISEEAIAATRKVIAARGQQQMQDLEAAEAAKTETANGAVEQAAMGPRLTNKDVIDMVEAKLSDQIILGKMRTTKCKFDTSPAALIQLKKSGASDAVVLALTNAQCAQP
jgi:tetratricopeptide (TPR) repeat protein